MRTLISAGQVLDPAQGMDRRAHLVIEDDLVSEIIEADSEQDLNTATFDRRIDASGCVVMAGGIDLHTHIGGGKLTLARMLLQDLTADEHSGFLPSAAVASARYLDMGFTTCFEPAVIPCNARSAHAEMSGASGLDTGSYCLLGNDDLLLQMIRDQTPRQIINDYVAWMVMATQSIAVKVVNAGGISAFKFNKRTLDVDTPHPHYGVTPADVIRTLCRSVHEIGLIHPLHVHCSNLGVPGNIASTIKTIEAADGLPIHLTHAQFHCYGDEGVYRMSSAARRLVAALEAHPNVTIDVGQIMFGQTVTISADSMHQFDNHRLAKPRKSALMDIECEAGCGAVPFRYRRKQFVHSLQWAIGLELFLMIDDPSRVFLTTDHPNGAPFTSYPHLIRLLCDRSFRETALAEIHSEAAASSELQGLSRELSLSEIATMTRSAPAAILGLDDLGNLKPGSTADVAIYRVDENREAMFARPRYVFKRGRLVRDGDDVESRPAVPGEELHRTRRAELEWDAGNLRAIKADYDEAMLMRMDRLWISDDEMRSVLSSQSVGHAMRPRQS